MSYILDALRRADAERERDPARGIHAQPAAGVPARQQSSVPAWAWPAGALLLVAAAVVVAWPRFATTEPAPAQLASAHPAIADVVPVAATVLPPAPPPPVIVERVRVVAAPAVAATVAKPGAPARAAGPAVVATAQPAAATPQPAATTAQPAAPPAAPAAAAAPAADRVFAVTELPADVQKDLPKLAITGGVHSENPAQRMLVVGGKVVNEGAELAPGVVLDQIRPRSAVLKFRGWKYSVGY